MVIQNGYGLVNGDDGAGVDPDNRFWNWDLYFGRCLDLYFGNTLDLYVGPFGDLYFGRFAISTLVVFCDLYFWPLNDLHDSSNISIGRQDRHGEQLGTTPQVNSYSDDDNTMDRCKKARLTWTKTKSGAAKQPTTMPMEVTTVLPTPSGAHWNRCQQSDAQSTPCP